MASLREEQYARRSGILVWFQSLVILALLVWISEDYNNNQYFQGWAAQNLGGLGFLLNGSLAAFYAGLLVAIFVFRTLPRMIGERGRGRRQRPVRAKRREEAVMVSPEAQ
ncbi:MAG TPA: hypothetical protein VGS11_00845 [Candidatus Bathyarchaeia archaeon]|nr:hypothetical protein [Candidatus Bathyarchaeia archaeon]